MFASFSFDTTAIFGVERVAIPFTSPALLKLASNLAPGYLRVGGSYQDHTTVNFTTAGLGPTPLPVPSAFLNLYLNESAWDSVGLFAQNSGLDLVWGMSAAVGRQGEWGAPAWNLSNAMLVPERAAALGIRLPVVELGNEVNVFNCSGPNSTAKISPAQLAAQYRQLRAALPADTELWGSDSSITGDVVGQCHDFYGDDIFGFNRDFLSSEDVPALLSAHTWHYYSQDARNTTSTAEFILTDEFQARLAPYDAQARAVRDAFAPGMRIIMGETASFWAGGVVNASNRFVSGFWYLSQLGQLARQGYWAHIRQDLAGGDYGLLDLVQEGGNGTVVGFTPNPDYYSHALWKRLVSGSVLDASVSSGSGVRAFAFCSAAGSGAGAGGVTVVFLNFNREDVQVDATAATGALGSVRWQYVLSPVCRGGTCGWEEGLSAATVSLNGVPLILLPDLSLPDLSPSITDAGTLFTAPAGSYGFLVFPGAAAPACMPSQEHPRSRAP